MTSSSGRSSMRQRYEITDDDIEHILNESEIEFSDSDSDGDPAFNPITGNPMSSTDNSESSDTSAEEITLRDLHSSPALSESSHVSPTIARPSGRGQGRRMRSGGSRSRGRARTISTRNNAVAIGREDNWLCETFEPEERELMQPAYLPQNTKDWTWEQYYNQYIDDDILNIFVDATNRTHVLNTGRTLGLTLKELKVYFGITMVMSALQYPQIDMYWSEKWRVPLIAHAMTRARFYSIRTQLKCVYDSDVTTEEKKRKLWKIQPFFERILKGCRAQNRQKDLCIDEMIIPFSGRCNIRQYCPNKPNPVGIKVFVLASPQGVVCDMIIYEGDTTFPHLTSQGYGLGESVVLHLTQTLVPGHSLYFDRYFTSAKLLEELIVRGFHGTGTVMRNRIPRDCILKDEKQFRKQRRGSTEVKVRNDGKLALTMWLDNKPVLLMSSCYCDKNNDFCQRWSKKNRCYERVQRPEVIKAYNQNMGGVDLTDRMLSVCPTRNRTKKWTIRVISHLFDLAVVNAWLLFRATELEKEVPRKKIPQLREYKLNLGTRLIEENDSTSDSESDPEDVELSVQHKKRKVLIKPIPSQQRRQQKAAHLPDYSHKQSRCRMTSCNKKTTVFCRKCEIYLCFVPSRNCFSAFHDKDE